MTRARHVGELPTNMAVAVIACPAIIVGRFSLRVWPRPYRHIVERFCPPTLINASQAGAKMAFGAEAAIFIGAVYISEIAFLGDECA